MVLLDQRSLLGEDHHAFRASVSKFLAAAVVPSLDEWRAAASPASFLAEAGGEGLLGTNAPEAVGGGGVDDIRFIVVLVEELVAQGAVGLAHLIALHCGVAMPLIGRDNALPRREELLAGMVAGTHLVVPVASGVDGGELQGVPGGAVVSSLLVSGATGADRLVLVGVTDTVGVTPVVDALGGRDCPQGDIVLAPDNLAAGPVIGGSTTEVRMLHHIWMAVLAAAGARQALRVTTQFVRERQVFGKPLMSFENTRFRLAEIVADLDAVQRQADAAIAALNVGALTEERAAAALLCARRVHDRAVDQGLQFHGGYGYMREYPISIAFADAQYLRQYDCAYGDPRAALADALERAAVRA